MKTMGVNVTKNHIVSGDCRSAQRCAIAQAIRATDPTISYVAVRTNKITVTSRKADGGDGVRRHYAVPTHAARFIVAFDAGEEVSPFQFRAQLIDETPIVPASCTEKAQAFVRTKKLRAKLKAKGKKQAVYGRKSRVAGV